MVLTIPPGTRASCVLFLSAPPRPALLWLGAKEQGLRGVAGRDVEPPRLGCEGLQSSRHREPVALLKNTQLGGDALSEPAGRQCPGRAAWVPRARGISAW